MPRYKTFGKTSRKKIQHNRLISGNRKRIHECLDVPEEYPEISVDDSFEIYYESSAEKEQPNISNTTEPKIDKEVPTSSVPTASDLRSLSFTPDVSDNDDLSSDGVDFESFFEKPKAKTRKVEITYECDWKDCGKCFVTTGDFEKHKKTHLVDNDTISQKCTKCDARFDSFELVKIHFLEAHTKWKKEDVLDERKASEDVVISKECAGNEREIANKVEDTATAIRAATKIVAKVGVDTKEETNKYNSKNILNRRETDKIFSAITTRSRLKDFKTEDKDTILNEKQSVSKAKNTILRNKQSVSKSKNTTLNQNQPVPNPNNLVVDNPKTSFVIFSDNAIEDSNNPTLYVVNTKPNLENSTTLSTNTAINVPNKITQAGCSSSFTEHNMTNAKLAMSYAKNLMPVVGNATCTFANARTVVGEIAPNLANIPVVGIFTPNHANVIAVMEKVTPNLATFMGETAADFAEDIPVKVHIIPKAAKVIPNLNKYISPDVANTIPEVKTITSNAITMPEVSKITSMLANIIPVVRNLSQNVPKPIDNVASTAAPNSAASTVDLKKSKVNRNFCQCSNCLDSSEYRRNGRKVHRCDSCGHTFTGKFRLDKHNMKEHTGAYFCPFTCGKRFNSKDERTRHMQVHTKLNIFVCEICQKGFFREDLLKKHAIIHSDYSAETRANSDGGIIEINDEIDSRNNLSKENTDNTIVGNTEGSACEITDENDSEAEDNNKNSTSSDEDSSSEEENITNENVEAPSLVEDEVCLDLGENIDNTTPDPLSGITSYEDMSVPLPQIIKREEETTEPMLSTLINIAEENMEIIPVQRNNTEENIDLIAHIVNIRKDSLACMPLERTNRNYEGINLVTEQVINVEECVEPITQIVNIDEDRILERSMEFMPFERIERVYEGREPMPEQAINTEECEEPMTQIINIGEDSILAKSMEFMPLNRVYGGVEPISEKVIYTEECVTQIGNYGMELMPLEAIKREDEGTEPISEQIINTEDCVVSTPIQILNTGEVSMESTPSGRIKREIGEIDPISEQLINTVEESMYLIPAKRIKREEDHIKYVLGHRINVADADLALRSLSGNKVLQVLLERLPFDI